MADRYWVAGGTGNYNSTTNWSATSGGASGATVPSTVDDVFFNVLSGVGTAIITSGANCRSLNLTGFIGTIQFDNALTLNTGSIFNLGTGGYTQTGAIGVHVVGTSLAITSNGTVWSKRLYIGNNGITITMNDTLTITGEFSFGSGAIINGFTINISGNFTTAGGGAISGTTSFVFNGNTTWSSSLSGEELRKNVTINTAGTITMSGIMAITGGTFTYTAGTVNTTAFTLKIGSNATTFNCSGITWENVVTFGASTTITLTSNFNVKNFLLATTQVFNSNSINISGNLTVNNAILSSGTSVFVLNGTGTWSHGSTTAIIFNPLTINTAGTITLGTNVLLNGSALTYTTGTIINTGSTLTLGSTSAMTINTSGMTWNNVTIASNSSQTTTLSSNLNIGGNLTFASGGVSTITFNTNTIFIGGNFSITGNSTLTGTSLIVFNGTGTWSNPGAGIFKNNTTVNTTGTLTLGATVRYDTGTLTYTAGTVVTTGSTLTIGTSTTLNTNGITWNNITIPNAGFAITLGSNLTLTGTLSITSGILSFVLGVNSLISTNANLTLGTAGTFTMPANQTFKTLSTTGTCIINSNTLTITENLTIGASSPVSGTTTIVYGGTGTWTAGNSAALISNNLTINTAGTLTISGIVYKQTATFTYTAGTIIDTTGTVAVNTLTLNLSGFTFRKLLVSGVITLTSNINATTFGTWSSNLISFTLGGNTLNFTHLELGNSATTTLPTAWVCQNIEFVNVSAGVLNTNSITINGNILQSGSNAYSGTTTFTYVGTGNWTAPSINSYFSNSFTINTAGTLTIISANLGGGIFTYTAGTVITTGSTLSIVGAGTTMNDGIIVWYNVFTQTNVIALVLNNQLVCSNALTINQSQINFSGADGTFDVYYLNLNSTGTIARNPLLVSLKTYRVRAGFTSQGTLAFPILLQSTIAASQAIFTVDQGATINVGFVNTKDINSSLGRPIYSYKGVFSNTLNWNVLPTDVTPKVNTFAN